MIKMMLRSATRDPPTSCLRAWNNLITNIERGSGKKLDAEDDDDDIMLSIMVKIYQINHLRMDGRDW